ncbi:MAG: TetR/AcrR family transcriptional regulator, partial [Aquamicrobium sp.]|nr:TetR/AcrR family transcriptional regulator [Aquamicrobium sp.]
RGRPKRVRTRARILAAAASELASKGHEGLTVEGICAAADMARGTFYLYYADRSKIAVAVYRMFWTAVYHLRPRLRGRSLDERIRVTNAFYLALYARNAAFLAGQASLARDRPDFALWHDQLNHRWSLVVAANMPGALPRDEKILRARALTAMADELLSNIFTARTPSLRQWANHPERLADCLTAIWTRVVVEAGES